MKVQLLVEIDINDKLIDIEPEKVLEVSEQLMDHGFDNMVPEDSVVDEVIDSIMKVDFKLVQ